jgi:hypothetical protein
MAFLPSLADEGLPPLRPCTSDAQRAAQDRKRAVVRSQGSHQDRKRHVILQGSQLMSLEEEPGQNHKESKKYNTHRSDMRYVTLEVGYGIEYPRIRREQD